jgi:hypothetical protein
MVKKSTEESAPSYWLIVESPTNWEADRKRGFASLGVSDYFRSTAASLKKGDVLIAYVSKAGAFADVRTVESDELTRGNQQSGYDRSFPWEVRTSSLLALDREHWIGVRGLLETLQLTRGKQNWSWVFRTSIRRMDAADGKLLVIQIRRAARRKATRPDRAR